MLRGSVTEPVQRPNAGLEISLVKALDANWPLAVKMC